MPDSAWMTWRRSAALTRSRLQRIIRNTHRFSDETWEALLGRIDRAIDRDRALLNIANNHAKRESSNA